MESVHTVDAWKAGTQIPTRGGDRRVRYPPDAIPPDRDGRRPGPRVPLVGAPRHPRPVRWGTHLRAQVPELAFYPVRAAGTVPRNFPAPSRAPAGKGRVSGIR